MKGAIVHGVLLVAMLLFGYQTWTREKDVKKTAGEVVLWNAHPGELTSIVWETPKRTTKLERKGEGAASYLWGVDTKITKKTKPKPAAPDAGVPAAPVGDAGVPAAPVADGGVAAAATDAGVPAAADAGAPAEPEQEIVTSTREYPVGEAATKLLADFSAMRALRALGPVSDDQRAEYGFEDEKVAATLTVIFAGQTRSLVIGKKATGATGKYAVDVESGQGYVIADSVFTALEGGETSLKPKLAVPTGDAVAAIELATPAGKSRRVDRLSLKDEKTSKITKTWGDKATGAADTTAANFLSKVETELKPNKFEPTLDLATATELVTLVYRDAKGGELGKLTLYKRVTPPAAPPEGAPVPATPPEPLVEYFIVSTLTRVPATVQTTGGDQVEQNIATVLP